MSTETPVSEAAEVTALLSEYYFLVEPTLEDGVISFFADAQPNKPFDVHQTSEQGTSVVKEFLTRLSGYLTGELEIECVEVAGVGDIDAWLWRVTPDGEVTFERTDP